MVQKGGGRGSTSTSAGLSWPARRRMPKHWITGSSGGLTGLCQLSSSTQAEPRHRTRRAEEEAVDALSMETSRAGKGGWIPNDHRANHPYDDRRWTEICDSLGLPKFG